LKQYVSDKTNWRAMLQKENQQIDLLAEKQRLLKLAEKELKNFLEKYKSVDVEVDEAVSVKLTYPIISYPKKINALSLEKTQRLTGKLLGIKGQYLILDSGVINIRKYGGYQIRFQVE